MRLTGYFTIDFLALTRFGEMGRVSIAMDTATPVHGRDVIIVEDLIDTGLTLATLRRIFEARGVASLAVVTLPAIRFTPSTASNTRRPPASCSLVDAATSDITQLMVSMASRIRREPVACSLTAVVTCSVARFSSPPGR